MSIGTVGSIKIKADKVAEFEQLFSQLTATVRAREPGNLLYQLVKIRDQTRSYKAIELYRDQAASDLHVQSVYLREALPGLNACLDGIPVVERIETVG
jgi:quinol monooxygenase YgiN